MLKSALQSSHKILILFLIISSTFTSRANVIFKEYILFDVASTVYDLTLVKTSFDKLLGFSCIYPASLFVNLVGIDSKDTWLLKATSLPQPLTPEQKGTLDKMIKFYKLLEYVRGQQVYMEDSLTRLLKQSYKVNGCKQEGLFNKELMTAELSEMAKLEVMFNKRRQRLSRFDQKKLDESLEFIYSTIDKQISHRYIWQ